MTEVQSIRERKGWSVRELSRQSGVDLSSTWRIDTGRVKAPSADKLQRIAKALGVSMETLLAKPDKQGQEAISG